MLIKQLRMKDFRQFKGNTKIDFSTDDEKNVTIILGDNTYGKTTLLQAFNWCFYEIALFEENADTLLNYEVLNDMNEGDENYVEVEITLLHNDTEYIILRTQKYQCINETVRGVKPQIKVSYKQSDGQTESVKALQINNVINNILPQDLSTYFFFDTERVNNISTRKDVKEAVNGLLGLSIMDGAIKHLGKRTLKTSVIGKLYSNMDQEGDEKARQALDRIQTGETKREELKNQLEECNEQINHYSARKEQLDSILADNRETSAMQKRINELEKKIVEEQKVLNDTQTIFFKDFSKDSMRFFVQPLLIKAATFLKEAKLDDKGIKDLTKTTIDELLKRGKCICGNVLCEGNDAYKKLQEELRFVPPESIGNTVRHYKEDLSNFSSSAGNAFDSLSNRYTAIYRSKTWIMEWSDEILSLSDQIKGKENMSKYEEEVVEIKRRLKELSSKRDNLNREDAATANVIEQNQKVYDSLMAVSGKNKNVLAQMEYAEAIRDWLEESYNRDEESIRESLQDKVNEIFESMYHGSRRVVIDKRYQVSLLTTVLDKDQKTGESEGLNRVKNFAFIAGLVSLAKERIIMKGEKNDFDLTSEPYPLVMDAPFSNADETHTANISKVLPDVAEQVIMFVMKKDWNYAQPVMESKVGKQYQLNKITETHTTLN